MVKPLFKVIICCLFISSCGSKPEAPGTIARSFIQSYFFDNDRSMLLSSTLDKAESKIRTETAYFEKLRFENCETERPAFFSMTDSTFFDLHSARYTFTIHFQSLVPYNHFFHVFLTQHDGIWRVSDYQFTHKVEE